MSKGFASTYRIVLLAAGMLGCFAVLGGQLVYLHVIARDELIDSVDKARRQVIVEPARRGEILDARGEILATSRTLIVLGVDPQSLSPEDEKKWPQLAALLGMPAAELGKIFLTKSRTMPAPTAAAVKKPASPAIALSLDRAAAPAADSADDTVTDDTADEQGRRLIRWAKLSDTVEESTYKAIEALDIKGVYGQRVYRRTYPHNGRAAHIVGYVNHEGVPTTGIERYADFYLHGRDGWREGERDGLRRELAQFRTRDVPPSDGYAVKLTIDNKIQAMAEDELDAIAKKYAPLKATIIVSDPQTGFILAMANYPSFNLNEYNKVPKGEQAALRNVAVADMYEPGSVFKIVAAAGALNENLVTPATSFDCSIDKIDYEGRTRNLPREDQSDHFTTLTVAKIVSLSSNRGAAQLAMRMGDQRFYDYARAFGFGQLTGFPVGGEIAGSMRPPEKWDVLTITRMPMGQSIAATPLQMHMAMGVIASGGNLLRPQVISEIRDASGEVVLKHGPVIKARVITPETARIMARLLEDVVSPNGNAPGAAIPNYEVAGKTGTAQKLEPRLLANGTTKLVYSERHHVASFIGFLPASQPQVAISVIVDDADARCPGGVAYGAKVAAPSFKRLAEQLIPYRNIKPVINDTSTRIVVAQQEGRR